MGLFDWLRGGRRDGAHQRWVVVDVETSGMDVANDALISIGAVAIVDGKVTPGDSLEIIVRQATASSRENILVHGVGAHAQLNGTDPQHAVRAFMDYAGRAPMLAFHAPFDRSFLARVAKHYVNQPFDNPWLDIAELAPALEPKVALKSLDEWLRHYCIPVSVRHSAASDAFATALLMTRLLPEARRQGAPGFTDMQKLARQAKWLH
jgi:DNA polymerase-3 subunit epsilon